MHPVMNFRGMSGQLEQCYEIARELSRLTGRPSLVHEAGHRALTRLAAAEAQREEHAVRIFAAIAPLFIDIDREGAERLARGVHALRSTIWGASASSAASGDHPGSASDGLD